MITFAEYEKTVYDTAVIPLDDYQYYALGLVGEVDEFIKDPTLDEFGDVIWYWSILRKIFGAVDLDNVMIFSDNHVIPYTRELQTRTAAIAQLCNKMRRKEHQSKQTDECKTLIRGHLNYIAQIIAKFGCMGEAMRHNRGKLATRKAKGQV